MKTMIALVSCTLLLLSCLMFAVVLRGSDWSGRLGNSWYISASTNTISASERAQSAFAFINSIGMNTHLNYFDRLYGNFPLVEHDLASLGVRHLRDGVHLQDPAYNQTLYGRWAALGKLGIRFDAVLDPRSKLGPFTGQLLNRVEMLSGNTIEAFEGPNELDISRITDWPQVDRSYTNQIFSAVHSMTAADSVEVIGPSMAFVARGSAVGNLSDRIDFGNLHAYPAGKMPSILFPEQLIQARAIFGARPVMITESGYHNALNDHTDQPGVSEAAAAKYIPRLFLDAFAHGVVRTYLYEFLDEAPDPELRSNQLHWGLIRADGTEKPAFHALKNLIAELGDTEQPAHLQSLAWSLSSMGHRIDHLLLQKSDGEFDLILWQAIPSYDCARQVDISNPLLPGELTLVNQARSVSIYEPVLQAAPVHIYREVKQVPVEIPDHPLVVRILMGTEAGNRTWAFHYGQEPR